MEQKTVNNLLVVSEIELVYKPKIKPSERLKISSSKDLSNYSRCLGSGKY